MQRTHQNRIGHIARIRHHSSNCIGRILYSTTTLLRVSASVLHAEDDAPDGNGEDRRQILAAMRLRSPIQVQASQRSSSGSEVTRYPLWALKEQDWKDPSIQHEANLERTSQGDNLWERVLPLLLVELTAQDWEEACHQSKSASPLAAARSLRTDVT